ncbi:hypothetical protein HF086_005821 [Spodoptera exigua]|uniref:Uncharacterized protein n=1 Tax=Spodoptera exigua TaxID=7107 RepID=A0A922SAK2_SPOEX|nr:hypothetical protein HF086_005821 [Spodoptera exigua]
MYRMCRCYFADDYSQSEDDGQSGDGGPGDDTGQDAVEDASLSGTAVLAKPPSPKPEKAQKGAKDNQKTNDAASGQKTKKAPQARADDKEAEIQQRMITNLLSRLGSITQDSAMHPMLYGSDDSMFNVDRPTILHSENNSDIDYIVITI